jgi:hypothetical protein
MGKKKSRSRDEEYHLHAQIKPSVSSSYYISTRDNEASADEAIIDFLADIVTITPEMPVHVGQRITCSLMCSRTYAASDESCTLGRPLLLYVKLSQDTRLFSAYLPSDVFWALQTDLKSGRLRNVEVWFDKPRYGSGKLKSLYFSETASENE